MIYYLCTFSIYKTLETLYTSTLITKAQPMKRTTLDLLQCPTCLGELKLETPSSTGTIETGFLTCPSCRQIYPIQRGIPHFIKEEDLTGLNKPFARMYDWFS